MSELALTTNCLRCGVPCRRGTPDPKARAIKQSATDGFCPNCMITKFLLSIDPIRDVIEGSPAIGEVVPAREGKGPEILLGGGDAFNSQVRGIVARILSHTQMSERDIDWIEVVGNWGLKWPKGREPQPGASY